MSCVHGWFLQGAAVQEGQVTVVHDILKGHKVREALELGCLRVLKLGAKPR